MDEFIKKLIERLGKLRDRYIDNYASYGQSVDYGKTIGLNDAISIAKELAEEFATDINVVSNNGWIPCSDRLPNKEEYLKNDGRFIVTDGNRVYQSIYDIYICHCFRTSHSLPFGPSYKTSYEIDNCVIAWQPLPEPYKQGK